LRQKSLVLVILFLAFINLQAENKLKEVTATQINNKIIIDGNLNEPDWLTAGIIKNLIQQQPNPGETTPYKTTVKFLKSNKKLYIGIICTDPNPSKIAMHTMARDGDFSGDDYIQIIIDTFEDGRTGFVFGVNAAGARQDGLVSDAERLSPDWDGIWYAKTTITKAGWIVEMEIPASTLRFTPGKNRWRLEVKRYVARDRITLRWAGTSIDASRYDVRRTGILNGMANFNQGTGLSISPYAVTKYQQDFTNKHNTLKGTGGIDIQYNITPSMTGMLTLNTDFAETEVDNRRVNLTRFSLFFPEKRDFFLEGSNMFDFGAGLRTDFVPFYSRRIGLYDEEVIPIDYGLKVLGKQGNLGVALLDVETRDTDSVKGTNLFAGRITYDIGNNIQVGTIITNGDPDGVSDNTLVGIDVLWNTTKLKGNKNFSVGGWFATVSGDVDEGKSSGWGFKIDYPNDLLDAYVAYKYLGDSLEPALGFVPRPGTEKFDCGFAYQPRPKGELSKYVRQFYFEFYPRITKNLEGKVESWSIFTAPINFRTPKGEHYEFNIYPRYEFLAEGFEIAEGVEIPAGTYHFTRYRIELESADSNQFVASTSVWFGDFYNGRLTQARVRLSWADTKGKTQISLEAENYYGYMATGDFIERVYQFRGVYAFTPDLSFSSFTQYDSISREIGMHNRLRWTIKPGRDVFVVWNYGWFREFDRPVSSSIPEYNQIAIKLRWTWRK
jgi:hypothetical protein